MQVKDYPQMKIRLSPELKALIDESAQANNRTLNAEITARLEASFQGENHTNHIKHVLKKKNHDTYTHLYTYLLRLLDLAVHVGKASLQQIAITQPVVSTPSNRMANSPRH